MGQGVSGPRLEDAYYVQKVKLGQGTFGSVWRAVDKRNGAQIAVKQLDKASMPRRNVRREDVQREIAVMRAVCHENIIRLLDSFEDRRSIHLCLEYCDGGDFGDKVKERGSTLQEPEAADWIYQICSAIQALHLKGICHRDIKPDNFMVHSGLLKLADFGLALHLPHGKLLTEKCGTPAFMSPEQHKLPRSSRGYGHPADVWAAGVCMYMLMHGGRHPFLLSGSSHLDEKRLHAGDLNFSANGGFFGFGIPDLRFSESARSLCRRMVCPSVYERITAEEALQDPWLTSFNQDHRRRRSSAGLGQLPEPIERPTEDLVERARRPSSASIMSDELQRSLSDFFGLSPSGREDLSRANDWLSNFAKDYLGASRDPDKTGDEPLDNGDRQRVEQPTPPVAIAAPEGSSTCTDPKEEELMKRIEALERRLWDQRNTVEVMQRLESARQDLAAKQTSNAKALQWGGGSTARPSRTETTTDQWGRAASLTLAPSPGGLLQAGTRCRYKSASWSSWISAVVEKFNPQDGTYDLDVRRHARLEKIRPCADVSSAEAWPPGTSVSYASVGGQWLQAVVLSFNEPIGSTEGTYNLDVCECVSVDRIRPRPG